MSDPDLRPIDPARRLPGRDATATMPAECQPIGRPIPAGPTGPRSPDLDLALAVADELCDTLADLLAATGPAPMADLLLPRMGRDDYVSDSLHQLAGEIRSWQTAGAADRDQAAAAVCWRLGDLMRHAVAAGDVIGGPS